MSLNKARGNMYTFVTHTHSHLRGACSHKCSYCYAQDLEKRYKQGLWSGALRIEEKELLVNYGTGKTIFVEHMNDLFATDVPHATICRILNHCCQYRTNTYVFQSKNPLRFFEYRLKFPPNIILGTTIETNRETDRDDAPPRFRRMEVMAKLTVRKFVTIEPVMDFDVDILAEWICRIRPEFLNLGADSKNHNLPEPTVEKIMQLVEKLKENGIELREKHNLERLLNKKEEVKK